MGSRAPPRGTGPGGRGRWLRTDAKVREVVDDSLVGTVLFVDLENPAVFVLRGRKDPGFLAGQEDGGVGPLAVDEAPDYNHDEKNSLVGRLTPTRKVQAEAGTAPNSNPWYFAAIFYHGSAPRGLDSTSCIHLCSKSVLPLQFATRDQSSPRSSQPLSLSPCAI